MKKGKLYWVTLSVCATYVFCLAILATGLGISAAAPPFSFPDSNSTQLVSSPVDTNWWRAPRGVTTTKATFASVSAANSIAYKEFTGKHAFHQCISCSQYNQCLEKEISVLLSLASPLFASTSYSSADDPSRYVQFFVAASHEVGFAKVKTMKTQLQRMTKASPLLSSIPTRRPHKENSLP